MTGKQKVQPDINPINSIIPKRKITGVSAILLPFSQGGAVDWEGFCAHVSRTWQAGITPAVNMDTGYVNLLDDNTRLNILVKTKETLEGQKYIAGAYVSDQPGDNWNPDAYAGQIDLIQSHGAIPVIFQSYGLTSQDDDQIVKSYELLAGYADQFVAFELGKMFAPFGDIYNISTYERIMSIKQCIGAKHSSLNRQMEWQRLHVRDRKRPDFKVFTGNDLAIDMVMYGSDYLLGLSTFAPDLFSLRDKFWAKGDASFYELNDVLQYLGFFVFRDPVPAYKHSAAQFLHLRNWIKTNLTHPAAQRRAPSDLPVLQDILKRFSKWTDQDGEG